MKAISLQDYTPVINIIDVADSILITTQNALAEDDVVIDFSGIRFISTNCAKHIFGKLILELGEESFFDRVILTNACDNVKVSINTGIENALEDGFA